MKINFDEVVWCFFDDFCLPLSYISGATINIEANKTKPCWIPLSFYLCVDNKILCAG